MANDQQLSLVKLLDQEISFLITGCFYPSKKYKLLYILSSLIMFIYVLLFLSSMFIAIYFDRNNLTKLSENLLFSITEVAYMIKLTNFILKRNKFVEIETFLNHQLLNDLDGNDKKILDAYIQPFDKFVRLFRICIIGSIIFFGLFPYIDKNPNNLISLPGWFPFSIENYRFEIILAQMLGIAISALNNSTLDITMVKLVTIITAYLNILKDILKNHTNIEENLNRDQQEFVKMKIKKCVLIHNTLIEFAETVECVFGDAIFFQFLCSVIIICFTEFQMIVTPIVSAQFFLLTFYLSTVTCQVALYCWFGNELIVHSGDIPEACYMSNWINYDTESCKMLIIMMERGKRPMAITAGKFFAISLPTLMTVLRSSYSYFAVLRRFYFK